MTDAGSSQAPKHQWEHAVLSPESRAKAVDTVGLSRLDMTRMKSEFGVSRSRAMFQRTEIDGVRQRVLESQDSIVDVQKVIDGKICLVRCSVDRGTQKLSVEAMGQKIAEGGGKSIFKVVNLKVPEQVQQSQLVIVEAIGKARSGGKKVTERDERAGLLLANQKNPNIVRYSQVDYKGVKKTQIEFCRGGDLHKTAQSPPVSEVERKERLRQCSEVAHGLSGLHGTGNTHNDMKLENALLSEKHGIAKLADFDRVDKPGAALVGYTALYASPAAVKGGMGSYANDRHALGIMIFEMTHGISENPINEIGEDGVRGSPAQHQAKLEELKKKLDPKNPADKLIADLLDDHPETNPLTKRAEALAAKSLKAADALAADPENKKLRDAADKATAEAAKAAADVDEEIAKRLRRLA
jgi:serine/threonine protein kinase